MTALPAIHPDVPTHAEWPERGKYWALSLLCPFCGRVHHHGGGSDADPEYGHRVPHCLTRGNPNYRLIPGPPEMPKPKPFPRGRLERSR